MFRKTVDWLVAARSHRVICLLAGMWLINLFDVVLTVLAHRQGMLHELNPIAERLLLHGPWAVLTYKLALVASASAVLVTYRTRFLAEMAATGLLLIYALVAVQWRLCYELYVLTHTGDLSVSQIDAVGVTSLPGL